MTGTEQAIRGVQPYQYGRPERGLLDSFGGGRLFDFVHVIQHLLDKFINFILRDQLFKHLVLSHDSTREPFAIRGMLR